ncbi:MAG: YjfB family protein [Spirochaetales bacterium]|nr:YjfB family protein [Spirochaetales bacterium]
MEISSISAGMGMGRIYPMHPASGAGKVDRVDSISRVASVGVLKKSLDFQSEAAMKLLQSLPEIQDPALGRNVDTYA